MDGEFGPAAAWTLWHAIGTPLEPDWRGPCGPYQKPSYRGGQLGDPAMNPDRIAVIFLQPQCNMTCRFCITQDGFSVMDPEDVRALLEGLAGLGVGNVIFGGGEPLAWPYDLLGPARYARELGMTVQVGTNGIALTPRIMQSPALDRFILPLESAEARVHDRLRRARGGHQAVILDRLEALAELGREVTLSTVITRANRDGLTGVAAWIAGYRARGGRVHAWHLYRFLARGRGGSIAGAELGTTAEEYRAACDEVATAFPGLPILRRPDMARSRTVGFYWMENDHVTWSGPHGAPRMREALRLPRGASARSAYHHRQAPAPRVGSTNPP